MDYALVLMITAILWLILFLPALALALAAATYIGLFRRRNAALDQRLSREADEYRDSEEGYHLLMENASYAVASPGRLAMS